MEKYLQSFGFLSEEEIAEVVDLAKSKQLQKGELFIRAGQVSKEAAFVVEGCLRSFYYASSGEEVSYCLTFPNSFLTAYSSFITQEPTVENIEAVVDTDLLVLPLDKAKELEKKSYNWLRFFKLIAEQEYLRMEKRLFMLQGENAETRYRDLLTNHPEYLQMIPLHQLASYLGITQRHLSRIRKALAN